jgi:hypothetical protein
VVTDNGLFCEDIYTALLVCIEDDPPRYVEVLVSFITVYCFSPHPTPRLKDHPLYISVTAYSVCLQLFVFVELDVEHVTTISLSYHVTRTVVCH